MDAAPKHDHDWKGMACRFCYEPSAGSNHQYLPVDDSFVPMYDMELKAYILSQTWSDNLAKKQEKGITVGQEKLHIPTAVFVYLKRVTKELDPVFGHGLGDGPLFDDPLDHGHVILHNEKILFITDISLHYMNLVIAPLNHIEQESQK